MIGPFEALRLGRMLDAAYAFSIEVSVPCYIRAQNEFGVAMLLRCPANQFGASSWVSEHIIKKSISAGSLCNECGPWSNFDSQGNLLPWLAEDSILAYVPVPVPDGLLEEQDIDMLF